MLADETAASRNTVIGRLFLAFEAGQALAKTVTHEVREASVLIRETLLELSDFRRFLGHDRNPYPENKRTVSWSVLNVHRVYIRGIVAGSTPARLTIFTTRPGILADARFLFSKTTICLSPIA
jgi:hypothetical protein